MNIRNTTSRALVVPLGMGKKLHLGPKQTGQIRHQASSHPKFIKLVEAGELEILDGGKNDTLGSAGPDTDAAAKPKRGLR